MTQRRNFLRLLSSLPLLGGLRMNGKIAAAAPERDFLKLLNSGDEGSDLGDLKGRLNVSVNITWVLTT